MDCSLGMMKLLQFEELPSPEGEYIFTFKDEIWIYVYTHCGPPSFLCLRQHASTIYIIKRRDLQVKCCFLWQIVQRMQSETHPKPSGPGLEYVHNWPQPVRQSYVINSFSSVIAGGNGDPAFLAKWLACLVKTEIRKCWKRLWLWRFLWLQQHKCGPSLQ